MSSSSLPAYTAPSWSQTPPYTAQATFDPQIPAGDRPRTRPTGWFIKSSRNGDARLHLAAQDSNATYPVFGSGCIEGRVQLTRTEGVVSVEVRVEGRMRLREVAEGGTNFVQLCQDTSLLWIRDSTSTTSSCPSTLPFRYTLPASFTHEENTYPLPPTYNIKLPGMPGFSASIDYIITAVIHKPNTVPPMVPLVKSSLFGFSIGTTSISTPLIYHPRTRPATPLPLPLRVSPTGFYSEPSWRIYDSVIKSKDPSGQNITTKLYLPASRIFSLTQPIPFHLVLESSVHSLAAFLPFSPMTWVYGKTCTQIQLMRQSTVDVRKAVVLGTKTEMWRTECIGQGTFRHAIDGPTWMAFSGQIVISDTVEVTGFKAGGLTVKDFVLFSMTPGDQRRSPFNELRQVVPIRLTTDPADLGTNQRHADSALAFSHPVVIS